MIGLKMAYQKKLKEEKLNNEFVEKPVKKLSLADLIFKKINHNMRMSGESNIYKRYYKRLEVLSPTIPVNEINKINISGFGFYEEYLEMSKYIPHKELLTYQKLNKVKSWKDILQIKLLHDKNNNEYVGFYIKDEFVNYYSLCLKDFFEENYSRENVNTYLRCQQERDNNSSHITLINAPEYAKLKLEKPYEIDKLFKNNQEVHMNFYGIGQITNDKKEKTFYVIVDSGQAHDIRKNLNLPLHHLHCTLGFNPKDIFTKSKDQSTEVIFFDKVWDQFCLVHKNDCALNKEEEKIIKLK